MNILVDRIMTIEQVSTEGDALADRAFPQNYKMYL